MIRGIRIGMARLALLGALAFLGAFGCSSAPTAPSQGLPAASDPAPTPPSGNESTQIDAWVQDDDDTRDRAEGFWDTVSFDWELQKAVDPDEIVMEEGESREVTYNLTATRDPSQAAGVRGEVCVQNTGDSKTKNLTIAIVVQADTGAGFEPILEPVALRVDEVEPISVSCFGFEVNFDPIADATAYRVVAQVRIDNHSNCATGTSTCPFGPDADAEFDLPEEPYDALAEVTDVLACPEGFTCTLLEPEIDSTCTVTDSNAPTTVSDGTVTVQFTDSCHVSFLRTITHVDAACDATQELTNTATLVESDTERRREATATVNVTVSCQTHGQQGCSHGYWKNRLASWPTGVGPEDEVGEVFEVPDSLEELADDTLLATLKYGGGPGTLGGAKILLRQAAGALLNAAHPNVSFPLSASEVINQVNAALAGEDRSTMLALADELDRLNNLGCLLN